MMVRLIDEAASELDDAINHYELLEPGLGARLKEEARNTLLWIADHSLAPRIRPPGYRRVNLIVFPYQISYLIEKETIWILAFAHTARLPEYWIDRAPAS